MLKGFASPEGTQRFANRFKDRVHPDFFVNVGGLTLSSLGLGSYLGEPNDADDEKFGEALREAVSLGINVIDSAINYRAQRSERVIGDVLSELISDKVIQRDEIFVSTKGGFIPFDGEYPKDPQAYFRDQFLKPKLLRPEDVVAGCHSLSPSFISNQFEKSRSNLNLETIDLYYLHNPETQLEEIKSDEFMHRLHRAFVVCEEKIKAGELCFYGTATWNGFRVGAQSRDLLNLSTILEVAKDHGSESHFKFIQLPLNLALTEALTIANQSGKTILAKAQECGVHVMSSSSLMQAQVVGKIPPDWDALAPGKSDAVKALNFVRSAPGIDVALCGMKQIPHVQENLTISLIPKVSAQDLASFLA